MYLSPRHLLVFVIPVLVVVAVAGFAAGKRHGAAPASPKPGLVGHQANLVVEYPSSWQPVSRTPPIPGVALVRPLLLAPGGDATIGGLVIGQLPAGESGPVPSELVARMQGGVPPTQVVNFVDAQAYRYGPLQLSGYTGTVELYAIPMAAGSQSVLICYAAKGSSSGIHACEQIVASLTLVEHTGYDLTPNADYAGRLSALVTALDSERSKLRREMSQGRTPGATAGLATTLASRLTAVAASIRGLQPPAAARVAQTALVDAIERAHTSYGALAAAAGAAGGAALTEAEAGVAQAELGVNSALETFALLGYEHS